MKRSRPVGKLELLIGVALLMTAAVVLLSNRHAHTSTEHIRLWDDAMQDIKLDLTTSHLWFEELAGGDSSIDPESQIRGSIRHAQRLCVRLAGRGPAGGARLEPLGDAAGRAGAARLCDRVMRYRRLTEARLAEIGKGRAGTPIDQAYDRAFGAVMGKADLLEHELRSDGDANATTLYVVNFAAGGLILALLGGVALIGRRHTREVARIGAENRAILDSAGEGVLALAADGRATFANAAAGRLTGYQPSELIGRHVHELLHHTRADGSPYPAAECPTTESLRSGISHQITDEVLWRKDGTSFPVEYTSTPITGDDGVEGAVIVFKDVTEARRDADLLARSEQLLAQAQELAAVGSWSWEIETGEVTWSDQLYRMSGLDPDRFEVSFEGFMSTVHPDDRAMMGAVIEGTLASGEPFSTDFRIVRPDGAVRINHSRGRVVKDVSGAPVRMFGVVQDVTEAREIERMKDEFTSVVSHELRTPLTSIRGSLGLLADGALGPLPEKGQRMVDIAVQNTDRLVRLINDILDIDRMESGRATMEQRPCEVADLLRSTADVMTPMAEAAGVALEVRSEPATVSADPDRIVQALTNLVGNALKFSPAGGSVRLAAQRLGDEMLFSVRDEGRGIPPELLESIFERFQQVDASDSRLKGGTGLGLAICRSIVQHHGGRIWAESQLGAGSTFFFTLPAVPAAGSDPVTRNGDRPTVLVCDDDPGVREVVSSILDAGGYRVIPAASGAEAVARAAAERPDVILLDLIMPGMDGWQTAVALRDQAGTEQVPIIILSVLTAAGSERPEGEVVDWLEKPVEERSLMEAICRAIDRGADVSRVLVAEDDPDLASVLTAMFERHGIEPFHASTGAEAIELSQREQPDLLVLDVGLPGLDGFAVVEWLRRHERLYTVPVVVYTARDLTDADMRRLRLGGDTQFFTKARVPPDEFERLVIDLLGRTSNGIERGTDGAEAHPAGR